MKIVNAVGTPFEIYQQQPHGRWAVYSVGAVLAGWFETEQEAIDWVRETINYTNIY